MDDTVKIQGRILLTKVIRRKDRKALARLHSIYYSRLKRYITLRINSLPDAEDLTQNLFFELCEGYGHYDSRRDAEAYLFGIARNLISHYYQNRRKYPKTVRIETIKNFVAGNSFRKSQTISLDRLRKLLTDATEQLPPKAKEAIRIRLIEGLSPKEAAQKCGCSTDTFYKRFNAALKALEVMREKESLKADNVANL